MGENNTLEFKQHFIISTEKKKLEELAGKYFLNSYNKLLDVNFEIKTQREKPDLKIVDKNTNTILGIEITHLYYGTEEAKILFGRTTQSMSSVMKPGHLIENLNGLLKEKVSQVKNYDFPHKILLVIRVASRIFDKSDFDRVEKDIIVPPNIFSEIWLLPRDFEGRGWGDIKKLK